MVIGKMKDIEEAIQITDFVGLKAKIYSYRKENDGEKKTNKSN